MALREVRDRGMTEAALSVDTNNPGGAFQLYTSLGFELRSYEAVYYRPVG
jgi:ribosomal protein S18 acetylase RimI-like enzyme